MDYCEICIYTTSEETREILTFLLAEEGFESFVETKDELLGYISDSNYLQEKVEQICDRFEVKFTAKRIADQNWNILWEKNFEPVLIAGRCYIRAPFHSSHPEYPYELIIEPKMSFGTAHHETTAMMIEEMLQMNFKNKKVLDMGCGTGILSILANKLAASNIDAIDNDSWAYNNALENVEKNQASAVKVRMGDVDTSDENYDVILANINRNVLLGHLHEYSRRIKKGELLLSGFYEEDLPMIRQEAEKNGFTFDHYITKNRWTAVRFIK